MKKKKILIYSGSRSDYGILKYLIFELKKEKFFDTKIILSGSHFNKKFGYTFKEVKRDKIKFFKINSGFDSDDYLKINKSLALLQFKISKFFIKNKADYLIVLGDRLDLMSVVYPAILNGIKVCHIHGGELTYKIIDEYIRHAITKLSDYHFVSNEKYRKRVIQMGEDKNKVYNVGSLSIDGINKMIFLDKSNLEKDLKIDLGRKFFIITYQPLSVDLDSSIKHFDYLLKALKFFKNFTLIFTFPNIDFGSEEIIKRLKIIKKKNKNIKIFKSLGHHKYISLARHASAIIGNSSSGIIEIPYLGVPVINIGDRQNGREKNNQIINLTKPSVKLIINSIKKSQRFKNKIYKKSYKNKVYGSGNTAIQIVKILKKISISKKKYFKKFFDY